MPNDPRSRTQFRVQIGCGLLLVGILYAQFSMDTPEPVINTGAPVVYAAAPDTADDFERLLRKDPLAALIDARTRLSRTARDYTCTFVKQERIDGEITDEQETNVKFRSEPYSVMMEFTRNAGLAKRAIYVRGKWRDEDTDDESLRELAVCQPANGLSLLIKSIKQPIHGPLAKRTSRRAIDEFGFNRLLDLLVKYCEKAKTTGDLKLEYIGETRFDGRDVWLVRRTLPYSGENGLYPDRIADIYVDCELRVPVAVYTYSHDDRKPEQLLGKYEYRNVLFNVGLTETDFEPATYGM